MQDMNSLFIIIALADNSFFRSLLDIQYIFERFLERFLGIQTWDFRGFGIGDLIAMAFGDLLDFAMGDFMLLAVGAMRDLLGFARGDFI